MTISGKIYAVPVNVHRSNLIWYSPQKLAQWGISAPPTSWPDFLSQADMLKARGVKAISVGATWTQMHLLENVLLGQLGASEYKGLWNGSTDWRSPQVIAALETFKSIMAVADVDTNDWQPNLDKVFAGTVAYNVMGDWAAGYLQGPKSLLYKQGFDAIASPGTAGIFNFLADSFVLSRNAPHQAAAEAWLKECASAQAQDIFNPLKGSVPARLDADKSKYTGYLSWAINEWQGSRTVVVGSLVHGAAANNKQRLEKRDRKGVQHLRPKQGLDPVRLRGRQRLHSQQIATPTRA